MANKLWTGATSGALNVAGNYSPSGVPAAGDNLTFAPGYTNAPSSNLTALNNATLSGALGTVIFAEGWSSTFSSTLASPLQFTCTRLDYWSSGTVYLDLQASTCSPQVFNTAAVTQGNMGLYLIGSALAMLIVQGGTVGLAAKAGQTSTVAEARCTGSNAKLYLGSGVSATTVYSSDGGTIYQRCASTTTKSRDGVIYTEESGAITTMTLYGRAIAYPNSSGTIGTLNLEDENCRADFTKSAEARTVTDANVKGGELIYDAAVVTFTNAPTLGLTGRVTRLRVSH